MRDRSVEYPNRYRMTLVPGTTDIYEMTPVPGEVYEEGTLMSKGNILDDNSEMDIWGTIGDRTPNDAFSFIGKSLSEHDEDIANLAATLEGKIVTGTYTGTVSATGEGSQTIDLGVTPKAVFISVNDGTAYAGCLRNGHGSMTVTNVVSRQGSSNCTFEIVENGFRLSNTGSNNSNLCTEGLSYMYLAFI